MWADDICLWPDGTWYYHYDLPSMSHMSDDYEIIECGSARWEAFIAEHDQ